MTFPRASTIQLPHLPFTACLYFNAVQLLLSGKNTFSLQLTVRLTSPTYHFSLSPFPSQMFSSPVGLNIRLPVSTAVGRPAFSKHTRATSIRPKSDPRIKSAFCMYSQILSTYLEGPSKRQQQEETLSPANAGLVRQFANW